jgi:hypothetical protein
MLELIRALIICRIISYLSFMCSFGLDFCDFSDDDNDNDDYLDKIMEDVSQNDDISNIIPDASPPSRSALPP